MTTYGVPPNEADWYFSVIVTESVPGGTKTCHIDGYAKGDKPTLVSWRARRRDQGYGPVKVGEFTVTATKRKPA